MTHRLITVVALPLALGVALGCGGDEESQREQRATRPPTAGEEAPAGDQPPPPVAAEVSDAEVAAFADVTIELIILEEQGLARVEAGEPVEQVQADLQPRVTQVFQGSVLTPERYNEIADQAGEDPALRNRIQQELRERVGEDGQPV